MATPTLCSELNTHFHQLDALGLTLFLSGEVLCSLGDQNPAEFEHICVALETTIAQLTTNGEIGMQLEHAHNIVSNMKKQKLAKKTLVKDAVSQLSLVPQRHLPKELQQFSLMTNFFANEAFDSEFYESALESLTQRIGNLDNRVQRQIVCLQAILELLKPQRTSIRARIAEDGPIVTENEPVAEEEDAGDEEQQQPHQQSKKRARQP